MIRQLRLRNFKCFKDQQLDLKPLTLLSGLNGTGKSSVLQALLLLRHDYACSAYQELLGSSGAPSPVSSTHCECSVSHRSVCDIRDRKSRNSERSGHRHSPQDCPTGRMDCGLFWGIPMRAKSSPFQVGGMRNYSIGPSKLLICLPS